MVTTFSCVFSKPHFYLIHATEKCSSVTKLEYVLRKAYFQHGQ